MLNYCLSFCPFIVYWLTCGLVNLMHENENTNTKIINQIDKNTVLISTIISTLLTCLLNILLVYYEILNTSILRYYYILVGVWWIDTFEYFLHVALHKINFLYKNAHKTHHTLYNPYHYGALYNSTFESILESSILLSGIYFLGFSYKEYIITITLGHFATVIDHTFLNYKNKFHYLHHSQNGNYNFQQPFFTYYDKLFGTYKIN